MSVAVRAAQILPQSASAEVPLADPRALGTAAFRWGHPESGRLVAAFGEAERREGGTLRTLLSSLGGGAWFGAAMFDPLRARGPEWEGFAAARFVLPALVYDRRDGRAKLTAYGPGAQAELDRARRTLDAAVSVAPAPRGETPPRGDRSRWDSLVSFALRHIRAGTLDKVVLARVIDVACDADPDAVVERLERRYPSCRSFLVRAGRAAFVGATPEMLCRVAGGEVVSDALAGSAPPEEADELLRSAKDLREHRWVVDHVASALERLCARVERGSSPGLRRLPNVVHLHTPIRGRLRPGRSLADVVEALHPTPAVGGVPTSAALQFIREYEGFDRGLYAGLVGMISPDEAELAVALRCALLRPHRARLFAGAGIVDGSSPGDEWAETELKAAPLLDALGVRG